MARSGVVGNIAVVQSEAADNGILSHSGTADKLTAVCSGAADDIAVAQSEAANSLMLSRLGLWISSPGSARELPMILQWPKQKLLIVSCFPTWGCG